MDVDHGELLTIAAGYIWSYPQDADTVAAWLAWSLPRSVDACSPQTAAVAEFTAGAPVATVAVRRWVRWCHQRAEALANTV
ncbi:hypothetical protein [Catellatospora sp. NPDC049133]|uniref:hypothetical protein n=1 Tax=Catellatospora sp. NPDC049133 TaxID=3155499 RepID=UPI00341046CB